MLEHIYVLIIETFKRLEDDGLSRDGFGGYSLRGNGLGSNGVSGYGFFGGTIGHHEFGGDVLRVLIHSNEWLSI